jgi:hypothetical protein
MTSVIDRVRGQSEKVLRTRVDLLDQNTTIENYERRFSLDRSTTAIDAPTRHKVEEAFARYLETIPRRKRFAPSVTTSRTW